MIFDWRGSAIEPQWICVDSFHYSLMRISSARDITKISTVLM